MHARGGTTLIQDCAMGTAGCRHRRVGRLMKNAARCTFAAAPHRGRTVGHNYIGHIYTGQNYTGHNYIGQLLIAVEL